MSTFYATYPPNISGTGVPTYANFAAFPSASAAGNGALAIALDTDTLYISNGTIWEVIGGPGVALSIGTFDSEGSPSANALTISTNALIAQSADATHPGMVNTTTQTFAGVKTFSSAPNLSSLTQSLPLQLDASKNIISSAIDLNSAEITGTLQPGHGGTGVTSLGNLTEATSSVLTITGGTGALVNSSSIQVKQANTSTSGYLSSTDWNTFNNKQATITEGNLTEATSSVLTITGGTNAVIGSGTSIQVKQSSASVSGYLSSTDWNTFNNKGSGSVTSVGLSVPATSIFGATGTPVTGSGTLGLTTTGTSGGIPYFSSTSALSSSGALTASQLVLGGGAGATPTSLAAGSQYQVLTMGASNPGYGAVNLAQSAAITGTLPVNNGGTGLTAVPTVPANSTFAAWDASSQLVGANLIAGTGDGTGSVAAGTLRGPAKTGSNAVGVDLTIEPGNGTGTGGSGNILFKTAPVAGSSSSANTYTTVGSASPAGLWTIGASGGTQLHVVNGQINLIGGQLQFPASQNASANANTLDDYSEGTWTPTLVSSGGGGVTYSVQVGTYTKIGRLVIACCNITITASTLGAGTMKLGGFPYTAANIANQPYNVTCNYWNTLNVAAYAVGGQLQPNTSSADITAMTSTQVSAGSNSTVMTATQVGNAASFVFTCTYFAAT